MYMIRIILICIVICVSGCIDSEDDFIATEEFCNSIAIGTAASEIKGIVAEAGAKHLGLDGNYQPVGFGFCTCSLHLENEKVIRKGSVSCKH